MKLAIILALMAVTVAFASDDQMANTTLRNTLQAQVNKLDVITFTSYTSANKVKYEAVDASGGLVNKTLAGGITTFIKTDTTGNKVHIIPDGTNTIMGLASYDLTAQYESVTFILIGSTYQKR